MRQEGRQHGADPYIRTDHYSEWRASIRSLRHNLFAVKGEKMNKRGGR